MLVAVAVLYSHPAHTEQVVLVVVALLEQLLAVLLVLRILAAVVVEYMALAELLEAPASLSCPTP